MSIKFESPIEEETKKKIMELCIRNSFYVSDTYMAIYDKIYPPDKKTFASQDSIDAYEKKLKDYNRKTCAVLIVKDGVILAYSIYANYYNDSLELAFIFVRPELRGMGCGKKLIEKTDEILTVAKQNSPVRYIFVIAKDDQKTFYLRNKFRVMPKKYSKHIDEVEGHTIMWLHN